jgi:acyl-CoA synthetase (NDP forming)
VVTADLCAEFGLQVPTLPPEQVARIGRRLPPYWSHANPVDIVGENDPELPLAVMEELLAWEGCDAVIHLGILGRRIFAERMADAAQAADPEADGAMLDMMRRFMRDFEERYVEQIVALMARYKKPVIGVSLLTDASDRTVRHVAGSPLGAVFFPTPERAVQAFARMVDYAQFLKRTADGAA